MKKLILALITLLVFSGGCLTEKTHKVIVTTLDGGLFYKEVIVRAEIAGHQLPSNGTTELTLKEGKHDVIWTYANVNGMGMYLNQKVKIVEIEVNKEKLVHIAGGKISIY